MNNPFSGIPMPPTRSTWELLPLVVRSLVSEPAISKDTRAHRLGIGNKRMQAIINGLLAIGVLERIRVAHVNDRGQKNTIYRHRFSKGARRLFAGRTASELHELAYAEFDRQYGPNGVPSKLKPGAKIVEQKRDEQPKLYGGPHRGVAESKPGWPKMLPCPLCRTDHLATWEGDRYHTDCRRVRDGYVTDSAYATGYRVTASGGRRPV